MAAEKARKTVKMSATPMQVHFSNVTSSSSSDPRSEDERIGKYQDDMKRMIDNLDSTRKAQTKELSRQIKLDQVLAEKEVAESILEELEERISDLAGEERKFNSKERGAFAIREGNDPDDDLLFDYDIL